MGIWQAVWLICLGFSVGSSGAVRSKRIRQFPNDDAGKSPSTTFTPSDDEEDPVSEIPCAHRNQCGSYAGLPFHARNCFCDSSCRAYGDCCRDYDPKEAHGPGSDVRGPVIPHSVRGVISCRRVEEIDTSYEMYIVDSCPKGFKDRFIVDKCQNELTPGLFYRLPVTGRTSGVLYRNVYCALCAGEPDVIYWEMAHRCSEADWSSNGALRNIKTAEEFRRLTSNLRCPVEMIAPMGKSARKCKSNVDRCPRKWRDDRVASKCKSYTAYVYHGLQVFKNKHCAICNNIDEAVVQCDDTRTPWPDFDSRLHEGDAPKETTPSSVYIVLDTNTGSGIIRRTLHSTRGRDQLERPGDDGDSVVVELGRCTEGSVYDVFADTCRYTGCRDGKCFSTGVNLTTTVLPVASNTTETETVVGISEKTTTLKTHTMAASTIAITSRKTSVKNLRPTSTTRRTFLRSDKDFETSSSSTTTPPPTTTTTATTRDRTSINKTAKTYKSTAVSETTTRDKSRKSKSRTTSKSTTRMRTTSTKLVTTPTTTTTTTVAPTATTPTTFTTVPTTLTSSTTTATSSASTATSTTTVVPTPTTKTTASTISTTYTTTSAAGTSSSTTAATRRPAFVQMIPIPTVGSSPMRQTEATDKSVDDFVKVTRSMRGRQMDANPKDVKLTSPSTTAATPEARSAGSPVTSLPDSHSGNLEGEMELSGGDPGNGENNSERSGNCSDILVMFQFDRLQSLASFVGTLMSLISLLVSFITILVLPSMRQTVRGKVLLSLILSLFITQLLYLMALPSNNSFASRAVCYWTGTVLHYCVLAVFFWVSVLAIDTALNIMGNQRELETCERWGRVFGYSLYAWLTPAVIVAACLTAEALEADHLLIRPCYGQSVCWVTGRFSLLLTVALPAGVLTLVSIFLYFLSASHMCVNVTYKDLKTKRSRIPDGRRLAISVCLTLIVAFTWVAGFVATFSGLDPIWWVFIGFSSAQGSFICVGFFCTRKIFQRLRDRGQNGGKGSSSAPTTWSYQKDRGPSSSTVDRSQGNNRLPGAENEIVLHETSM